MKRKAWQVLVETLVDKLRRKGKVVEVEHY